MVSARLTRPGSLVPMPARIRQRGFARTCRGATAPLASEPDAMRLRVRNEIIGRLLRLLPRSAVRRFVREQDGAAAIEFGLVAVPFLALTFAIMETALVFFSGQTLEAAAAASSVCPEKN